MSQHDHDIANQTFPSFRSDLNNALGAILTNNSGNSAPTTTSAYMWWVDTTNTILKMRNGADSAWISLMASDGSAYYSSGSTAAAPAYSKADDTNTGVFFPAADTLSISTTGSERMRVNSSGNVGIGTTTPASKLDISTGGAALDGLRLNNGTREILYGISSSGFFQLHDYTDGVTRMTIDTSGKFYLPSIATSGTDNGTIKWNSTTGEIWADSSSKRFKENIVDIEIDSSLIYQLEAKQYNKKGSERIQLGYIAEQVADIIPIVVGFDKDDKPFNVNYEYLTVPIIEEMKKLKSAIDKVKEKVKALESKVN